MLGGRGVERGATGLCDQRHRSNVYNVRNAAAVISAGHKNSVTTQRPAETEPARSACQMAWLAKTRCAPPSPVNEPDKDILLDFHRRERWRTHALIGKYPAQGQPGGKDEARKYRPRAGGSSPSVVRIGRHSAGRRIDLDQRVLAAPNRLIRSPDAGRRRSDEAIGKSAARPDAFACHPEPATPSANASQYDRQRDRHTDGSDRRHHPVSHRLGP
jgi:hypothetical protein